MNANKIKLGIECENLEDGQSRWGVGHMVLNLLEEYTKNPSLQEKFELHLYFKKGIPADAVFQNPMFIKKVVGSSSFNIFYHIKLPLQAMRDDLDWMFFPAYMLPPLYLGRSVVMLTNDVYYEFTRGTLPFKYRLAYRLFTTWAARTADKILAISHASKKEVARLYGIEPKRIFVSRLGVTSKQIHEPNSHGEYILYVGQMFPRRHAYESLLAFEHLASEFPDLKFIMVGRDKYAPPRIKETVASINKKLGAERVIQYDYLASDEEIAGLYAHAKLCLYVSSHEAFGLPPMEAAGYGTPVVMTDNELGHELLDDAAFYVSDPDSIDEIATAIRRGLTDEEARRSMKERYPELLARFNWKSFAENFFHELSS